MARHTYLEHLRAVPLFANCSDGQLEEVGRVADEIQVNPGQVLMRQGDIGVELFIIVAGTATVERDGQHVADLGPGRFVGEMAVLSEEPRNATVTAATELTVLVLSRRSLTQLLDDVPGLAKRLLFEVVQRMV